MHPHFRVSVREACGRRAFHATSREIRILSTRKMIIGVLKARELKHVILTCPLAQARRAIRAMTAPDSKAKVTTRKQARGAKHWVPRFDRAQKGHSLNVNRFEFWFGEKRVVQ